MALKIRLRRMGRKKAPSYRIVVAESSMPRDGRFVANLGQYNPRTNPVTLVVDAAKAQGWLAKGAVPTETVEQLFKRAGVYSYEAPTAVEGAVEAVTATAKRAAQAVAGAASSVAGAVAAAAASVTEAVTGRGEEPAAVEPTEVADTETASPTNEPVATAEAPLGEATDESPATEEPRAE